METITLAPNHIQSLSLSENKRTSNHENQPSTHLKHGPTLHAKPSPDYRGALFPRPARHQDAKGHPVPNLCILLSTSVLSQVMAISTSPLPAPLCPLYLYRHIYIYILTKTLSASPTRPHDRLWSLISNTKLANSHKLFEGALFHLQNTPEPGRKRATPLLL